MNRAAVDARIHACEDCRTENRDCPELVREMDNRLDVLHDLRGSVPPPHPHAPAG